jgi:hypothetical protein
MATSPSDHNNKDVRGWLDRMQESNKRPRQTYKLGGGAGLERQRNGANRGGEGDEWEFGAMSHRGCGVDGSEGTDPNDDEARYGDGEDNGDDSGDGDRPKLPDPAVPLGLIANLSLCSHKGKVKAAAAAAAAIAAERGVGGETERRVGLEEDADDDEVVRVVLTSTLFPH